MGEDRIFVTGDDTMGLTITHKARRNRLAEQLRLSRKWREVVPGATGLTVQHDPSVLPLAAARACLEDALSSAVVPEHQPQADMVIPVCYAPEYALDLAHICTATGLSRDDIITLHTKVRHQVDRIGFTPGFAYLEGGAPALDLPRLDTPRTHVPAGSIGLAGGLCGLYALPGPGGWPIIGRTPLSLFNPELEDPFCLAAGQIVRFEAISKAAFEAWT